MEENGKELVPLYSGSFSYCHWNRRVKCNSINPVVHSMTTLNKKHKFYYLQFFFWIFAQKKDIKLCQQSSSASWLRLVVLQLPKSRPNQNLFCAQFPVCSELLKSVRFSVPTRLDPIFSPCLFIYILSPHNYYSSRGVHHRAY